MKLLLDADGLIKLVHSGIFRKIKQQCVITEQVYDEVVTEGKKRLYEDAFVVEKLIEEKKLQIEKVKQITPLPRFGKGEESTLALFKQVKADVVITDDRKFLTLLGEEKVPHIVPTECIVALVNNKTITKAEGEAALGKIKPFIREENYKSALQTLGGKQ